MNLLEASLEARPVKEPYHHLMHLENRLMRLLGRKHYVPAGANDITKKLGLGQAQAAEVRRELRGLLRSGRVVRLPDKRFALPAKRT